MSYLLDTNILSELARPAPHPKVVHWTSQLSSVAISVVTVEELGYGLAAKPSPRIERFIERFIDAFCRVHDVTRAIALHAGIMRGQLPRRGQGRGQADMLIAATASAHGLTLVTRDEKDFEGCGVSVLNPFD